MRMRGSSKEDLGCQSLHSKSNEGSPLSKEDEPVTVVKVRKVRKAGQEGVKSEEMGIRR